MTDLAPAPPVTLPAVRVGVAAALTAALAATTLQPQWRTPAWTWLALAVVLALVAAATWSCTRRPVSALTQAWSIVALVIAAAGSVDAAVATRTDAAFTPSAVTALLLLAAGETERRSATTTEVPGWLPVASIAAAVAALAGWTALDGSGAGAAAGVATLVAAAPGTVRLARPAAVMAGRRHGTRLHLTLAGDTPALASRVDATVLAPHGTVTTGDLHVVAVRPVEPDHDRNLRWFAGALSQARDDRVGRAVARLATGRGRLSHVEHEPAGSRGTVDRHPVRIGDPAWLRSTPDDDLWTVLAVEVDGRNLGSVVVAEQVRDDAATQVDALRALGVEPTLVSEDTAGRAQHVADACGLARARRVDDGDDVQAVVAELRRDGRVIAVAGPDRCGADVHVGAAAVGSGSIAAPDHAVGRVVDGLRVARAIDTSARRGLRVAAVLALAGAGLAAAGLFGPMLAAGWGVAGAAAVVAVATAAGP